jgi:hypothetical protein
MPPLIPKRSFRKRRASDRDQPARFSVFRKKERETLHRVASNLSSSAADIPPLKLVHEYHHDDFEDKSFAAARKRIWWLDRAERQKAEVRGQRSEVRGQKSEARGQRSEVRSQKSEVRGQRSEVRSQRSEARSWQSYVMNRESRISGQFPRRVSEESQCCNVAMDSTVVELPLVAWQPIAAPPFQHPLAGAPIF